MRPAFLKIFSLGLLLAGCGSHDGAKPSAGAPQSFTATPRSAKSLATANHVLDLTVPASAQPQTDSEVFDDSVVFAPNFALNQSDPALSDLFDKQGFSQLCVPTSLAEALIYLFAYHTPRLDALPLAGLSADKKSVDPNALVRSLVTACHTDFQKGTNTQSALSCVKEIFSRAGYQPGDTKLSVSNPTLAEMRAALKTGNPILLDVSFYHYDAATRTWAWDYGHMVTVFGYDYDNSWGENELQLKVVNPLLGYDQSRKNSLWDTITLQRLSPQGGITYPLGEPFIVSGNGFNGAIERGFVRGYLELAPAINWPAAP